MYAQFCSNSTEHVSEWSCKVLYMQKDSNTVFYNFPKNYYAEMKAWIISFSNSVNIIVTLDFLPQFQLIV